MAKRMIQDVSWNRDSTKTDGDDEIQVIGFTVPKEVQNEIQ